MDHSFPRVAERIIRHLTQPPQVENEFLLCWRWLIFAHLSKVVKVPLPLLRDYAPIIGPDENGLAINFSESSNHALILAKLCAMR